MSALKGRSIEAFLKNRDPQIPVVLVYGPDLGLVRERADALARSVVADFKDPFNYVEFTDADLKAEPTRLADEAAALSFAGGERVVRLRTTGETSAKALKLLIDGVEAQTLKPGALTIIEAGDLSKRSGVRKMFEAAKHAVALPSYVDNEAAVRQLALDMAAAEGLIFDLDALSLAVPLLGEDRGVSRQELEKLVLYAGPKAVRDGPLTITVDQVRAVLIDTQSDAVDEIAAAAADGASEALARALFKARNANVSAIGVLLALQRGMLRLKAANALMESGHSALDAMKKLKPPVFFMEQKSFQARLGRWSARRVDAALDILLDAELAAKKAAAPQAEIVERAALRIAAMAGR